MWSAGGRETEGALRWDLCGACLQGLFMVLRAGFRNLNSTREVGRIGDWPLLGDVFGKSEEWATWQWGP